MSNFHDAKKSGGIMEVFEDTTPVLFDSLDSNNKDLNNVNILNSKNIINGEQLQTDTVTLDNVAADFVEIDNLTISCSGRELFKAESLGELLYLSGRKSRGPNTAGKWCGEHTEIQGRKGLSENNVYYIPFSELQTTDSLSGGSISLKSLNSIQVHVEANDCKNNADYVLETITLYNQIIQISGSSGRIVKSLDS